MTRCSGLALVSIASRRASPHGNEPIHGAAKHPIVSGSASILLGLKIRIAVALIQLIDQCLDQFPQDRLWRAPYAGQHVEGGKPLKAVAWSTVVLLPMRV